MRGFFFFLQNNKKEASRILKNPVQYVNAPAVTWVFNFIVSYLVDETLIDVKRLKDTYQIAERNGYAWLAAELKLILHRLQPDVKEWENAPELIEKLNIVPLIDLFPRIEEWENALSALLGMFQNGKTGNANENDARVIWLVNFETRNRWMSPLQPREQTYGKSGWTSGRAIALTRLKNNEVPSMTEQDRRIARHIHGYSSSDSYIDFENAIPDLVGHPYLYLEKSPTVGVQLMEDKLALVVKEKGDGYQVQFSHSFDGVGNVLVKESPTRYKLLKVTDEHVRIAQMFNGKSLQVPKQGEDKLKEVLGSLSKKMTVQSSIEDQNIPIIEADSRVCVHLLPVGDGFHVELYAKPFGETPPYFKIGKAKRASLRKSIKREFRQKETLN
ncbi:MAG: hypothetical protein HC817_09480 [Saprospiraceae bacterium]|nr:hypothetical protein [Saprospiraceae bacterium]